MICFDFDSMARKKLVYAKALVEISPSKPLPSSIRFKISEGVEAEIIVRYGWKPDIRTSCQSFGHLMKSCARSASTPIPLENGVPFPYPTLKWVLKPPRASKPPTPVTDIVDLVATLVEEPPIIIVDPVPAVIVEFPLTIVDPIVSPVYEPPFISISWYAEKLAWIHRESDTR